MITKERATRYHKPKPTSSEAYANGRPIRSLTKAELAVFVPCSERFLEMEVKAGRLRSLELGKRMVRFTPEAIQEWMKAGRGGVEAK